MLCAMQLLESSTVLEETVVLIHATANCHLPMLVQYICCCHSGAVYLRRHVFTDGTWSARTWFTSMQPNPY